MAPGFTSTEFQVPYNYWNALLAFSSVPQVPKFDSSPPVSTEKTAVWHWIMDNMTTTVIFTKDNSEVWCNGVVLDTMVSQKALKMDYICSIEINN